MLASYADSELAADGNDRSQRREVGNVGFQLDLHVGVLSRLDMTLSVGFAQAFEQGMRSSNEFMISLKILFSAIFVSVGVVATALLVALQRLPTALLALARERLATRQTDDVAELSPAYVALPRGVKRAAEDLGWSPDLR